jgi:Family of unknown function (DUF6194)
VIEPEEILSALLELGPGLTLEAYYGERAVFYNPGRARPLGIILASVKDRDGPNDASAELSRPGVFRLSLGITRETYVERFGVIPARPPRGGVIALDGYDPTRLDTLMPHPVYGWMYWLQILSPSRASFDALRPLLDEALGLAETKWQRRERA